MFNVNAGVIASRNKGQDFQGKSFLFPVMLSDSPNTLRGYNVHQFNVNLSALPNVFTAPQINQFPVNLNKGPLLFVGPDVDSFPVSLSATPSAFVGPAPSQFPVLLSDGYDPSAAAMTTVSVPTISPYSYTFHRLGTVLTTIGFLNNGTYQTYAVRSTDGGFTWTSQALGINAEYRAAITGPDRIVVLGGNSGTSNRNAVSLDGISWSHYTNLPTSGYWYALGYGNGVYYGGQYSGSSLARSTDGITWTTQATTGGYGGYDGITYGNGTWLSTHRNAPSNYTSPDGITWTARTRPYSMLSFTFDNGLFFGTRVSAGTELAYSADGITWTTMTMPISASWSGPIWSPSTSRWFIAANSGATTYFYTSTDLVTWTPVTTPSGIVGNATRPVTTDNAFVGMAFGSPNSYSYRKSL